MPKVRQNALADIRGLSGVDWQAGKDAARIGHRRIDDDIVDVRAFRHERQDINDDSLELRPEALGDERWFSAHLVILAELLNSTSSSPPPLFLRPIGSVSAFSR
ncbi:hypothetical protein AQZ52_00585 [Novosphingobium fuchskuhlense]|uniref:Uncharacterized protein n=1 Tax=Novosphingobium fuchskuhlense TaxID=1117702 RepID=A0A117UZ32_9SPHN|nr:hypothetical protein AQZ52_00585 [Novosphingobium fuchskuhlense]